MISSPVGIAGYRRAALTDKSAFDRAVDGYTPGTLFGLILLLLVVAIFCVETARIFNGSVNMNPRASYGLYGGNVYSPPHLNGTSRISRAGLNVERGDHYLWPWSSPALLFLVPLLLASLFGICAGQRGTYSMIYLFYAFSLITFLLSPFLIGFFSVRINRHDNHLISQSKWKSNVSKIFSIKQLPHLESFLATALYMRLIEFLLIQITEYALIRHKFLKFIHSVFYFQPNLFKFNENVDRSLSIVLLVLSLLLMIVSFLATLVGGLGFDCCQRKVI